MKVYCDLGSAISNDIWPHPVFDSSVSIGRKMDVESRYYADGEDAYAMKRELAYVKEDGRKEKEIMAKRAKHIAV